LDKDNAQLEFPDGVNSITKQQKGVKDADAAPSPSIQQASTEPGYRIPRRLFLDLHRPPPRGAPEEEAGSTTTSSALSEHSSVDVTESWDGSDALTGDFVMNMPSDTQAAAALGVRPEVDTPRNPVIDAGDVHGPNGECKSAPQSAHLNLSDRSAAAMESAAKLKFDLFVWSVVFWSILSGILVYSISRDWRSDEFSMDTLLLLNIFLHKSIMIAANEWIPDFPGRETDMDMLSYAIVLLIMWWNAAHIQCESVATTSGKAYSCKR
jgi:hypothetical protein